MCVSPKHAKPPTARRHLSFDPLVRRIRDRAEAFPDDRRQCDISVADAIMSGFAVFALKDPSLLAFDKRRYDENIKRIFRVNRVPCDTHMREVLDPIEPDEFRPMFNDVFRELQRGKALEPFAFHDGCYLLSLDGTEYFCSNCVHCPSCLSRTNSKTGEITYYHQLLAPVLMHPDHSEVIPLAPEPILNRDGASKNDCERNAAKRLLPKIRQEHPHLSFIVVEDGLASNAPHIRLLQDLHMHFLLVANPDDHQHLFHEVVEAIDEDRYATISWYDENEPGVFCEVGFVHDLPLNKANPDIRVNYLCYMEYGPDGELRKQFTWVTDLTITADNATHLVRGGRSRWKVENETFNTLKNQGYHFEHNYGHGKQNLSAVFAILMMLAFLVDQTQELCCGQFQAVLRKAGSRRYLWFSLRCHFHNFQFGSAWHLYEVMLHDRAKELPAPGSSLHVSNSSRSPPSSHSVTL